MAEIAQIGDASLLDAARAGDRAAIEALLARYQPRIFRFSMKMCRKPEDAQDVLQDTLLAAARGLRGFRGDSAVGTWLYAIARSYCIKKRRRSRFAPEAEVSLDGEEGRQAHAVPDPGPRPDQQLESQRLGQALARAIGELAPGYREVLLLRDLEGLTAPEVAEVTGLSVQAVKSRLHRARAAVRESLAPLLGGRAPGAPCPDIVRLFSRHLEGEINPRTCARMERHLAECTRCQAACESLKRVLGVCRTAAPPELPPGLRESIRSGIKSLLDQVG